MSREQRKQSSKGKKPSRERTRQTPDRLRYELIYTSAAQNRKIKEAKERTKCPSGKIGYNSERDATRALLKQWEEGLTDNQSAYRCRESVCKKWHLTSQRRER